MSYKNGFRVWDNEYERENFTPEEIEKVNTKVSLLGKIFDKEQVDYITHEEATIKSFMKDPEYAEHLLSVVKADGDAEEIAYFQAMYDEAKKRSRNEALKISYPSRLAVNSKFVTAGAMA